MNPILTSNLNLRESITIFTRRVALLATLTFRDLTLPKLLVQYAIRVWDMSKMKLRPKSKRAAGKARARRGQVGLAKGGLANESLENGPANSARIVDRSHSKPCSVQRLSEERRVVHGP